MFNKYLQDLGLSDKEAEIYVALLQVENSSVLDLAKKTKIKRPTVYVVLEQLSKKGLVSETIVGTKTYFQAESPERVRTFVEKQKAAFDEKANTVGGIIEQLKTIQKEEGEKPLVKYFEGVEGIISANEGIFEVKDDGSDAYMVYSKDIVDATFKKEDLVKFKKGRVNRKIHSTSLYNYEQGEIPADEMSQRIRVDYHKYPFKCDITVYQGKTRISILGDRKSGILVESQDFADTMKSLIKLASDKLSNK